MRPFYSVKAVLSGNVIYFPLFVEYDVCDILPVRIRTSHQPSEKGVEKKNAQKQRLNQFHASEEKQIHEIK